MWEEEREDPGEAFTLGDELLRAGPPDAGDLIELRELQLTVTARKEPVPWDRFLHTSGNPLVPAFGDAMDRTLSPQETAELTSHLRPLVESGTGRERRALAYLTATQS